MGKFTSFVLNQGAPEQSADVAAALAAADAQFGGTTVTPQPVQDLQERVPQAAPSELAGAPGVQARAQAGEIVQPTPEGGVREVGPEEAVEQYQGQLQEEARPRGFIDLETGTLTLPMGRKQKAISKTSNNIARMEHAFDLEEGAFGTQKQGISGLAKLGLTRSKTGGKLQVPNKGTGGAAFLAMMVSLSKQTDPKVARPDEEGKVVADPRGQTIHKIQLANDIGSTLEQLLNPSPTVDPNTGEATQTGYETQLDEAETLGIGELAMRMGEQVGLVHSAKDGQPGENALITQVGGGGRAGVPQYALTEQGWKYMQEMAPVLEEVFPGARRPVSLTPQTGGQYVGEAATTQKEVTKTPIEGVSNVTPQMREAMDVMGSTPHMVSPHKLDMASIMLQDVEAAEKALNDDARQLAEQTGRNWWEVKAELSQDPKYTSPFARLFDLGYQHELEVAKESLESHTFTMKVSWDPEQEAWVTAKGNVVQGEDRATGKSNQDILSENNPKDPERIVDFVVEKAKRDDGEYHNQHASSVLKSQLKKVRDTLRDATDRAGKALYFGATVIGNSGRLMISQTELNYQSNKLARFLLDNPRPSQVKITNGEPQGAFKYVVARATIDGADTYTPQELVRQFDQMRQDFGLDSLALRLYSAMQQPPGEIRSKALREIMPELYANKALADEWEGTGEWGFTLDGMHEWGKFLAARDAGQSNFSTRVKAEVDGINNGSSIQGLQFGDNSILQRAGLIYDFEGGTSVIPEGNMRDFVYGSMFNQQGEVTEQALMDVNPNLAPHISDILKAVRNDSAQRKKFIKIPLMTTIYGKGSGGHKDAAEAFIAKYGSKYDIQPADRAAYVDAFRVVIRNALASSLTDPLVHQDLVKKQAGWFFNVMNIVPQIKGPNDFIVQAGGVDFVENPRAQVETKWQELDTETGERTGKTARGTVVSKTPIPSATARKPETSRGVEPWGEITRNQLAVNGTHNIDSTVAQETLVEAKKRMGKNFWGSQVFDAFIGDVSSLETMIEVGNKKFLDVNRRFNMIDSEYDAFKAAMKQFDELVDVLGDTDVDITDDGAYKGVKAFVDNWVDKGDHWLGGSEKFKNFLTNELNLTMAKPKPKAKKEVLTSKTMKMKDIKKLVNYMRANFLSPSSVVVTEVDGKPVLDRKATAGIPVDQAFKDNIRRTEESKQEFYETYKDVLHLARQFN